MEKSTQIFTIIKYQKKVLNLFVSQVFLECKYIVKEKKMGKYITDNTEIYSVSNREDSDEEISNEENFSL